MHRLRYAYRLRGRVDSGDLFIYPEERNKTRADNWYSTGKNLVTVYIYIYDVPLAPVLSAFVQFYEGTHGAAICADTSTMHRTCIKIAPIHQCDWFSPRKPENGVASREATVALSTSTESRKPGRLRKKINNAGMK